jgi:putative redox protein
MAQTLRVQLEAVGLATTRATARLHTVLVDRPEAKGGQDRGPLGGEYLLVALGGCFMSNLLAAIRARESAISNVQTDVTATMDGPPVRVTDFTVTVSAERKDPDEVRKLIEIAARACAVTNTLSKAASVSFVFEGTQVDVRMPTRDL